MSTNYIGIPLHKLLSDASIHYAILLSGPDGIAYIVFELISNQSHKHYISFLIVFWMHGVGRVKHLPLIAK